ncbi:5402_t:CDS:2 [Paraglomus brasilianum]|uniref:5402_t:CDS:1 n=1 Tax=Paraglomus brasilianum TaxID=144538 RepID=A0A9N8Z997_9GLOM|nr:5402_t:CDS:2 [Paraglomus brasilianum]
MGNPHTTAVHIRINANADLYKYGIYDDSDTLDCTVIITKNNLTLPSPVRKHINTIHNILVPTIYILFSAVASPTGSSNNHTN